MDWLSASLALWLALVASASGALAEPRTPIEMWLRKAGGPAEARVNLTTIDIAGLEFSEIDAYDLQYGKIVRVRGLHLRELMAVFKPIPETVDTMLLHFRGGMVVPVSIAKLRRNLEIFIAVAIRDGKAWRTDFPNAPGEDKVEIAFQGNKLVVGAQWRQSDNDFTPWRHVGSLKGVEFVEGAAYFAQWQPASGPKELGGHLVYGQRCQFCHGISGIGATAGPDFVRIMNGFGLAPTKKPWRRLLEQVRDPRGFGPNQVHRMPDQADFKESEAKALVEWAEAVAGRTPSFYEPSFAKIPQR
jgi:hypothetical protein